jgi:hypothetical protein
MDPYIEDPDVWSDFHGGLAAEIRRDLNQRLRPRYVARMVPYVTYEQIEIVETAGIRPDVGVWQPQPPTGAVAEATTVITPTQVESLVPQELPLRLYSVEIHATETLELVTAIEILSPVNKRRSHDAFHEYQRKRRDLLRSSAHLLEIDLLRGGERPPLERPVPPAPYYVTLSRVEERPRVKVWPIHLWDKLPVLPVPLREPDPDAALDLGALVAALYEHGGYDMLIDYRRPPPLPKLPEAEVIWLEEQLRKQGQR